MKKITLQDIFNAAWQAFIIENKPPSQELNEDGFYTCKYLTSNKRKCVIGLCLPDGHNYQNFKKSFYDLVVYDKSVKEEDQIFDKSIHTLLNTSHINNLFSNSLNVFQASLHDMLCANCEWLYSNSQRKQKYKQVAKEYNLTIPTKHK